MDDKAIAAAAIERLEAEKQRRLEEKVARGEAVLVPLPCVVVLGVASDEQAAAEVGDVKAREVARLRKAGETREIIFQEPPDKLTAIITGVPRCGRDESFGGEAPPIAKEDKAPRIEDFFARRRVNETLSSVDRPMPTTPPPASARPSEEPAEFHRIHVHVAPPTEDSPGEVIEGSYALAEDGLLRVYDTDQNLLGTERLKLGEDPARVARQLLRKKQGNGFDRRIEYPNLGIV
jgi:hypothetical protein